jgi:hypothetical protein
MADPTIRKERLRVLTGAELEVQATTKIREVDTPALDTPASGDIDSKDVSGLISGMLSALIPSPSGLSASLSAASSLVVSDLSSLPPPGPSANSLDVNSNPVPSLL